MCSNSAEQFPRRAFSLFAEDSETELLKSPLGLQFSSLRAMPRSHLDTHSQKLAGHLQVNCENMEACPY